MTEVRLNQAAIDLYRSSPEARTVLDRLGQEIADDARQAAPKLTGAGAASIDYEIVDTGDGLKVRVSWDEAHSYMVFPEVGTSRQSAQPFLRPAGTKKRTF